MNLSVAEKNIYNTYLRVSRSQQNKPWRPRKNFDNIQPLEVKYIKKINSILTKSNIQADNYFRAPYELWKDTEFYPLEFFAKYKARKTYNTWIEKLLMENPENEIIVNMIKEGFLYIYNRCKELKIKNIESYFEYKTYYPEFLIALSEKNICYYNILAINKYDKILKNYVRDDIDFIVKDFYNTIETLRSRYYRTNKIKKLNEQIITKLNKILNYGSI